MIFEKDLPASYKVLKYEVSCFQIIWVSDIITLGTVTKNEKHQVT